MSTPPGAKRLLDHQGRVTVLRVGFRRRLFEDLYFWLLRMPWRRFIGLLFAAYLAVTGIFAALYRLDSDAIAGVHAGSFGDDFFFSVETFATIGYGVFAPKSLYGHALVVVEAFVGMLSIAVATGLTFAKFSRPTARVVFSDWAVVAPYDGAMMLMIRMANARESQIVEAQLKVALAFDEISSDGQWMRRFHDLPLERPWSPLFALTWTAMHRIDERSLLYGATQASLQGVRAELIVSFSGTEETFGQTVHARAAYAPEEIAWGARFADVFEETLEGRRVDYSRLHEIERLEPPG